VTRPTAGRSGWTSSARGLIESLAARYQLPDGAAEQLLALLELVVSDPLAPTSVRDPLKVLQDHLADSLVALDLEPTRAASTIADLGAGAGFPGLPLAIALPRAQVALVESSGRKCAFIDRAIAASAIANARSVHARAESWTEGLASFDLVTARALAPLEVVAEYAAPLLRVGGAVVVWRGRRDPEAEAAAEAAAATLGLVVADPELVKPYPEAARRHLHLMLKVRDTPEGFPRRPGAARKRPLGSTGLSSDRSRR
jgi:16S rRNA (guanine527-N7)-methyltransferase